jgi:hypothetical protein
VAVDGAQVVRIQAGDHEVSEALVLEQPFSLLGDGAAVTTLWFDVAGPAVRIVPSASLDSTDSLGHASSIEGLTIVNLHPDGWALEMEAVKNLFGRDLQLVSGTYHAGGAGCLRILRGAGSAGIDLQGVRCYYGRTGLLLDGVGAEGEPTWTNANRIEAMIQGSVDTEVGVDLVGAASNELSVFVQEAGIALRLDEWSRYNQIGLIVEVVKSPVNAEVLGSRNRIVGHFDPLLVTDLGTANDIRGTANPGS